MRPGLCVYAPHCCLFLGEGENGGTSERAEGERVCMSEREKRITRGAGFVVWRARQGKRREEKVLFSFHEASSLSLTEDCVHFGLVFYKRPAAERPGSLAPGGWWLGGTRFLVRGKYGVSIFYSIQGRRLLTFIGLPWRQAPLSDGRNWSEPKYPIHTTQVVYNALPLRHSVGAGGCLAGSLQASRLPGSRSTRAP